MIRYFLIIFLILSIVVISGCTQVKTSKPSTSVTGAALEDQAVNEIEQEMEESIKNITMEDIENALLE